MKLEGEYQKFREYLNGWKYFYTHLKIHQINFEEQKMKKLDLFYEHKRDKT